MDPQPLGEAGPDAVSQPRALTSSAAQIPTREAQGEAASPPSSSSRPPGCGTRGGPSVGLPGVAHWAGCLLGDSQWETREVPGFVLLAAWASLLLKAALPSPAGLREGHFIPLVVAPPPPLSLQLAGATWKLVACLQSCPSQERT